MNSSELIQGPCETKSPISSIVHCQPEVARTYSLPGPNWPHMKPRRNRNVTQETQGIFETYLHEVHILRPRLLLTQRTAPPTIPPDQHPQQSLSASEQPCHAIDREDQEDATELPRWEGINSHHVLRNRPKASISYRLIGGHFRPQALNACGLGQMWLSVRCLKAAGIFLKFWASF